MFNNHHDNGKIPNTATCTWHTAHHKWLGFQPVAAVQATHFLQSNEAK